jgi:UDP-N-acetylglucosamine 2-epimerase (non-hydrolysing)
VLLSVDSHRAAPLVALHFAPTESAREALLDERVPASTVFVTGNTVIEALFVVTSSAQANDAAIRSTIDKELDALLVPG